MEINTDYRVRQGDVLFYSVGAYLGRANIVLEDIEAAVASFITIIRTKKDICNPIYLEVFLNSLIGRLQSKKWQSASAQQYIYPKEIKQFIIPLLPYQTQQQIASLFQQSHEARRKAKELLEIAKKQ
ncbi:MAG: restriction endonuclease subunit S [bacterium]